jgi:hypothetical protein
VNYAAHYEKMMQRARGRVLGGYRERHHVVPRCLGGRDVPDNIVELTAGEHYVVHQLLVKMHPGHHGLAYAVLKMGAAGGRRPFAWLRSRFAESQRGRRLGPHTAQHRRRISIANSGKACLPEVRAKLSVAFKGKPLTDQHRKNIAKSLIGHKRTLGNSLSLEHRARIAAALKGRPKPPRSAEHCARLAAALKGNRNRAMN